MTSHSPRLELLIADIIAHYQNGRRTFTEAEACGPLEEEGYNWNLAMDSDHFDAQGNLVAGLKRFVLAREADEQGPGEWYLASQTLANARLLERLHNGEWDGQDLDGQLGWLDEQTLGSHHIFCAPDPRLECVAGVWHLADEEKLVELSPAVRAHLDELWPGVLALWQRDPAPCTVQQLTRSFEDAGFNAMPQATRWLGVRAWLETQLWVRRVGADAWVLADAIPDAPTRSRLGVMPQRDPQLAPQVQAKLDAWPSRHAGGSAPVSTRTPPLVPAIPIPAGNVPRANVNWSVTLLTVYTVEGFLPVELAARSAYPPRLRGQSSLCVLEGQWFSTGERLLVWLDRETHRLYGPDLKGKLDWCDVGTQLNLAWNGQLLRLTEAGLDEDVAREESRLVDIEELARLRKGLGESYRASLAIILENAAHGLELREVVEKLAKRQGHPVHVGTIKAILRAGGFARKENLWFLPHPDQSAENLRQGLMSALIASQHPEQANNHSEMNTSIQLSAILKRLKQLSS